MDCPENALDIEKHIMKIKGIKTAIVNYVLRKGFVVYTGIISEEELKDSVNKAGFKASEIRIEEV